MKLHFGYILGFSAFAIAGCAAFFSVYGIGQLFQGAFWAVVAMASALEFGKLVAASFLQRYWKTVNKLMKSYLIIGVTFLMIITSGGIYGFLSSAYQETFQKLAVNENQISFLETKKNFFEDDVSRYDKELTTIDENIAKYSAQGVDNIQVRDENSETGFRNTISTAGLRAAQARIEVEEGNKERVRERRNIAADSLQKYQLKILEKQNETDLSGELGPLKYVANLTGVPMDKVVNWFILLFIFVFDPMAITLVIATNWVFEKEKRKNDDQDSKDEEPLDIKTVEELKDKIVEIQENAIDKVKNVDDIEDDIKAKIADKPKFVGNDINKTPTLASPQDENKAQNTQHISKVNQPVPSGVVIKKKEPEHGIKPEDVATVRQNAKNITRKIPAKRGY